MVSKGNKSKLVTSEICQKCGKCCVEFNLSLDIDCALRLMWVGNKKIKAFDTPFRLSDGRQEKGVCFKMPCSQLVFKDGKYSCSAWNDERPDFCNTYPDHIFYMVEIWNTEKIKKLLEFEAERCPALKKVSVRQVQEMLRELRGGDDDEE